MGRVQPLGGRTRRCRLRGVPLSLAQLRDSARKASEVRDQRSGGQRQAVTHAAGEGKHPGNGEQPVTIAGAAGHTAERRTAGAIEGICRTAQAPAARVPGGGVERVSGGLRRRRPDPDRAVCAT